MGWSSTHVHLVKLLHGFLHVVLFVGFTACQSAVPGNVTLELYCHKIWEMGSLFLYLAEQISKAVLIWITAAFMLITESYWEDNGTNIGCKMVTGGIANHRQPLIWGSWTRYGVWSVVGSQFSGVPSRTRLLLFEATPSDSLNDIGDPRRFWEGNQNRRHSHHPFPPSIPTIHSHLEMRKQVLLLETCFSGFPNFIFSLCAKIVL